MEVCKDEEHGCGEDDAYNDSLSPLSRLDRRFFVCDESVSSVASSPPSDGDVIEDEVVIVEVVEVTNDEDSLSPLPRLDLRFFFSKVFDFAITSAAFSTTSDRRLIAKFVPRVLTPPASRVVLFRHVGQEMVRLLTIRFKQHAQKVCKQVSIFGTLLRFFLNFSKQMSQHTSSVITSLVRAKFEGSVIIVPVERLYRVLCF